MFHQVKTTHSFVVNVADNGSEVNRVGGKVRGRSKTRDLEVQMIEGIEGGPKVKVGFEREGKAVVSKGPVEILNISSGGEFVTETMGKVLCIA